MSKLRFALAGLLSLFVVASAAAQPVTMPPNSVWGRFAIGPGPGSAIPFASLFANALSASGVPNAVLSTNGSGAASFSATLPSALTIPSPSLTGTPLFPYGANLPLFGGGSGSGLIAGSTTGNTTKVATGTGSYTPTNCIKSDSNGNLVDAGAPCGTGSNVSTAQDFIAGTGFTAGTTTSLTTSGTPISAASSVITFDGVAQSHNTWSLSGSTFTFNAAIPANAQVVEIQWLSTSVLPTWVTSIGGVNGPIALGTGLSMVGSTLTTAVPIRGNLLPNTQWQIFASLNFVTMVNSTGGGTENTVSVSSFTTGSNLTTFTTSNTQQLKAGDIVYFNTGSNLTFASMRVATVTPNVSFTAYLPGQLVPSSSTPTIATPITVGDLAGTSPWGPNGWTKVSSLILWRDTFTANIQPGSYFSLGMKKGASSAETLLTTVSPRKLALYQGRTVVFGAWVLSRANAGNGNFQLCINSTTSTCSTVTAGNNAYQWVEVSATIPSNATSVYFSLSMNGSAGDIYYLSQPMAAFGSFLGTGNYVQNEGEYIVFGNHINAPAFTPFVGAFPPTAWPGTSEYGWEWDIEALTNGQIARTVKAVTAQIEWTTPTAGALLQQATCMCSPGAVFGGEVITQAANQKNAVTSNWLIDTDGLYLTGQPGYFALYGTPVSQSITNMTVDFSGATLN